MKFSSLNALLCNLLMVLILSVGVCACAYAEDAKDQKAKPSSDAVSKDGVDPGVQTSTMRLESSVVTGNRELPKVMSIVPWKKAQPGDLTGRPGNSLLNELLTPVDREVFRRQLRYYTQLAEKARADEAETAND